MSASNQDFEVVEGAHRTITVPITVDGAPYLIPGGSTVKWWASSSQFDLSASVLIKKDTSSGVAVSTVGSQSVIAVTIGPTDTVGRGQKKLFHQGTMTRNDGVVVPLFSGIMTVVKRLVV